MKENKKFQNHAISELAYKKYVTCIMTAMANDAQSYKDNRICVWAIGERNKKMFSLYPPENQCRSLAPNEKYSQMSKANRLYWKHVYEKNLINYKRS